MTEVAAHGLTKTFGRVTAVRDMSFTAPAGTITGFLGPNGSGKTTTLRMALGLIRPTGGQALIGGVPYAGLPHPRRQVGALLEATGFHPGRRARDHLRVLAAAERIPHRGHRPEGLRQPARYHLGHPASPPIVNAPS